MKKNRTPWQLTRLLMVGCWFVWILTFFITVTLFQAVLQIHVMPQVVQDISKGFLLFSDSLVEVAPLDVSRSRKTGVLTLEEKMLDEMMVRYYLEMRYSLIPDLKEMERRWGDGGIVASLSAPTVYREFRAQVGDISKIEGRRPRVVDIISVQPDKGNDRRYIVSVDIYEPDSSNKWGKQSRRIVVTFDRVRNRAVLRARRSNPNGFVVVNVSESYLKN